MRYVFAALVALLLCAHSWYDAYCCNDKDCFPIDSGTVRVVAEGYMVKLGGQEIYDSHNETRPSGDDKFHICLIPPSVGMLTVRCFYAPPMGV
jgi:hypothetical protein